MPRKPRVFLPSVPCHVISRGNNRNACFFSENDYELYLDSLYDACDKFSVDLHAYVLMTNHVHLLLSPRDEVGISKVMQSIGRRYVQHINKRYRRSGTLWEGRFKSSLVDAEHYLLHCYKYIELNPVRAKMVAHPKDYPWSSYRSNSGIKHNDKLCPHPLYQSLGLNSSDRYVAYGDLFAFALGRRIINDIQRASAFSMPLGTQQFADQIERVIGREIGYAKRGRPCKPVRAE